MQKRHPSTPRATPRLAHMTPPPVDTRFLTQQLWLDLCNLMRSTGSVVDATIHFGT